MPDMTNVVPFQQRMYELIGPSLSPKPLRGTLGQGNTSGPQYFDVNGQPINQIVCGGSFTFDVPGSGLSQVWLTILKNGTKTFDGLFNIPMQSYATTCANDVGNYQLIAFDPNSGITLGQTTMNILPATGTVTTPGGGIAQWLANMSTTEKLGIAAGIAFLLLRRKANEIRYALDACRCGGSLLLVYELLNAPHAFHGLPVSGWHNDPSAHRQRVPV